MIHNGACNFVFGLVVRLQALRLAVFRVLALFMLSLSVDIDYVSNFFRGAKMKFVKGIKGLVAAIFLTAGSVYGMAVDFDLTMPVSYTNGYSHFAESFQYSAGGLGLNVTGLSSGGDRWNPLADATNSLVGISDYGLGVERYGISRTVDNAFFDYDLLFFSFDRQVTLSSLSLGYVAARGYLSDSDVSVGFFDGADLYSAGNVFDATVSSNSANLQGFSSDTWLIGAFNPFFGAAQDADWDGFTLDSISVNVGEVPLPAAIWLMASGMLALVIFRRKRSR
ncbi:MAG: hypothetical protein ACI9Y1_003112 [Lentisphaeria bacterium]|jgi:hypothetical protein